MRKVLSTTLLLVLFLSTLLPPTLTSAQKEASELNQENVEQFTKEFFERHKDLKVVGSAVTYVKDSKVIHQQEYGVENIKADIPVTPDQTKFRIGSVSKNIAALAIMQLVEQGKVDLHTDINHYLQTIEIPSTFEEPITIHDLLTHSAGFDDLVMGMGTDNVMDPIRLQDYLKDHLPKRIRKPDEFVQYSNHSLALVGAIIEDVSGMSYEEYIQKNTFTPFGYESFLPKDD